MPGKSARNLKEKIEGFKLPQENLRALKETINDIKEAENFQELLKSTESLRVRGIS